MTDCSELDHNTPLGTGKVDEPHLTLVSYNLLAPLYVRPIDTRTGAVQAFAAYAWSADEDLEWSSRQSTILRELKQCNADIICLQEVQYEQASTGSCSASSSPLVDLVTHGSDAAARTKTSSQQPPLSFELPAFLKHVCEQCGYTAVLPDQRELHSMAKRNARVLGQYVAVGNALLYLSHRLEVCPPVAGATRRHSARPLTRVGICLKGRAGTILEELGPLAVFSLHLDAGSEAKRVAQLEACAAATRGAFGTRNCLAAGDFNAEMSPGSCLVHYLAHDDPARVAANATSEDELARECEADLRLSGAWSDKRDEEARKLQGRQAQGHVAGGEGPTKAELEAWAALARKASAGANRHRVRFYRVETGATRAAYPNGVTAPDSPVRTWRLDHVLYPRDILAPVSRWATLDADAHAPARSNGIPCPGYPSDHMSLGVAFRVLSRPAALAASWGLVSANPSPEKAAASIRKDIEAQLQDLEASQATAAAALETELDMERPQTPPLPVSPPATSTTTPTATVRDGKGRDKQERLEEEHVVAVVATDGREIAALQPMQPKIKRKKGLSKDKMGQPSPAMRAHIRRKREAQALLKQQSRAERRSLLESMTDEQLDVVEFLRGDLEAWSSAAQAHKVRR